jgi:ATP synthase protein I
MNSENTAKRILLGASTQRILAIEALLVSATAWAFYVYQGQLAAQSALYGGCMMMLNIWFMHRRLRAAFEIANTAPGREIKILYISAILRFIVMLILFMAGMGVLHLPPIPLLVTFAIAQAGYFINGSLISKSLLNGVMHHE